MEAGELTVPMPSLDAMADRRREQLLQLPEGVLRLENPHLYKVSISRELHGLRAGLIEEVRQGYQANP
jgi:nicotinate phosphoribosyltransferase